MVELLVRDKKLSDIICSLKSTLHLHNARDKSKVQDIWENSRYKKLKKKLAQENQLPNKRLSQLQQ
jgi:hypothetical protein